MTLSLAPVEDRVEALDAMRGIALLGILVVNIVPWFSDYSFFLRDRWTSPADVASFYFVDVFASGKFYTTFSLLFGVGFAVQYEHALAKGEDGDGPFTSFFLRRMAALALFGALHATFLSPADILLHYSVFGCALLALRRLPPGWMTCLAVLSALAIFPLVDRLDELPYVLFGSRLMGYGATTIEELVLDGRATYLHGSLEEMVRARLLLYGFLTASEISSAFPNVFAMFLLGAALWRIGAFERPERHVTLWGLAWFWGLGFGILGNVAFAEFRERPDLFVPRWISEEDERFAFAFFQLIGGPGFCLFYVSSCVLAFRTRVGRALLRPIAPAGRMALTNYVGQSLACGLIFHGYGLGLYGSVPPSTSMAIALGIWLAQLALSAAWLMVFRWGPLEWIWRCLGYARVQPILRRRRRPASGAAGGYPGDLHAMADRRPEVPSIDAAGMPGAFPPPPLPAWFQSSDSDPTRCPERSLAHPPDPAPAPASAPSWPGAPSPESSSTGVASNEMPAFRAHASTTRIDE